MTQFITQVKRTHTCNALTSKDIGQEVVLMGWVASRRDHGGLIFIDLRDREGITQCALNPKVDKKAHELGKHLRSEYVMAVKGKVERRPTGMENKNLSTGEVEVLISEFEVFNRSETPPFPIEDRINVGEEVRLRYRYLDLRRPQMAKNMILRHRATQSARHYMTEHGFLEIETPVLTKSTPEGARDYLVPARIYPGKFYALPQSPQLFKQLLMVAGLERYFQIVKCFRDEDLRADRQPEFTQIDIEMSFVAPEDVFGLIEGLMQAMWKAACDVTFKTPFPRLTYQEAMERYGLDAPDTRFAMELCELSSIFAKTQFKVFQQVLENGGIIKGMNVKGGANLSRKEIETLTSFAGIYGLPGLAWIKVLENEWQSPIVKFFSDEERAGLKKALGLEVGDLVLFGAGAKKIVNAALGNLREEVAKGTKLIDEKALNFVWVTDFPLFEYNEEEKRPVAVHHPFTSPKAEDMSFLGEEPLKCRANAYDLVLNGNEIGGGSIRIHSSGIQKKIFELLKISEKEANEKFGFLLEAFQYGAPPHGGIAMGLDRIIMLMTKAESIRDIIAFPKTQKAVDLMCNAPSEVSPDQLKELSLRPLK